MPRQINGRPCLGYGSRTEAVFYLSMKGKTIPQIAQMMEADKGQVKALLHYAKRTISNEAARPVMLPADVLESLRPYAEARGLSSEKMVARLVTACVEGCLVGAVLDDEGGAAA